MGQLTEYIIALTNLYGLVHKNKVVEIYNSQNEEQVSISDVEKIIRNTPGDLADAFIEAHQDYFVIETILEYDEFNLMLRKKADKPHYVPGKNELLRYVDEGYFEKSKQYHALLEYVKKNFFDGEEEKAERLCEDIHGTCQFGFNMQVIMDAFNDRGIGFRDMDQVNKVIQLVTELSNNIRIWENNGHTPQEIHQFGRWNVVDLNARKKISRNDTCPCGSGKKYKKCCLGED